MLPKQCLYTLYFLFLFILAHCSTYQPLSSNNLSYKSIHIGHIHNKTFATELNALLENSVRKQIIQKSSLSIIEKGKADTILEVYLISFEKSESATQSGDPTKARSYNLKFAIQANLWDSRNSKYIFYKKNYRASKNIHNDFLKDSATEYQEISILVDQLANQLITDIINPWL